MLAFVAVAETLAGDTRRFDCAHCERSYPRSYRGSMLCGWMEPAERMAESCTCEDPPERGLGGCPHCMARRNIVVGGAPEPPTVCPGYTVRLPAVQHVVRMWSWWEKGQLQLREPEPDGELMDLVELFNGSRSMAQSYEIEERERRSKAGR